MGGKIQSNVTIPSNLDVFVHVLISFEFPTLVENLCSKFKKAAISKKNFLFLTLSNITLV